MVPANPSKAQTSASSIFSTSDVLNVLRDCGWIAGEASPEQLKWCERAATFLGAHATDRKALAGLLQMVFCYETAEILSRVESHVVLSRFAARDVVRQVALYLLDGLPLTAERFSEMVTALKTSLQVRGRELFHPLRLALAGRAGEGELDRVILLLDEAASLGFAMPVKAARQRVLEFCSALD